MKKTDLMIFVRWILLLAWIPTALIAGIDLSLFISDIINVWEDYVGAIVMPSLGIVVTYFIAPYYKYSSCALMYIIGLFIAFYGFTPSWYPQSHPLAYESTYIPFIITVLSGLITLLILALCFKSKRALTSASTQTVAKKRACRLS